MKKSVHAAAPFSDMAFTQSDLGRRLVDMQATASPSNRLVADYLLRNPIRVAAWSIEDFSAAVPVSTATLSRFARALGYKGYPELRGAIAETLQTVLQPVEKLRDAIERRQPEDQALADGLQRTVDNVMHAASALDPRAVERVVERLVNARTLYVMGFGISSHIAGLLTLKLQPFCPQLINVVEFGGTEVAAGRLMNAGPGDVLFAISFPRYAADAVQLSSYARDQGAAVISLTDAPASPLARLGHEVLFAPSNHPVLSSSYAASITVIEAVVTGIMTSKSDNVQQAARLTEAISQYLLRGH